MRFALLLTALSITAPQITATIVVGPFTFENLAFADIAEQVGPGLIDGFNCNTVQECLTGNSPNSALSNIGAPGGFANLFQFGFTDLMAVNGAGADIVFFDALPSADPFEIAVRPLGGVFTSFLAYPATDFVDTGVSAINGFATLAGLPIDLSSFGLPSTTVVDAIQVRALVNALGLVEGDPVMAAVLNPVPEPNAGVLFAAGMFLFTVSRKFVRRH